MKPVVFLLVFFCAVTASRLWAQADGDGPPVTVPPEKMLPDDMLDVLRPVKPPRNGRPKVTEVKASSSQEGGYVLAGDLFHSGDEYALVALQNSDTTDVEFGFAEWKNKAWKITGQWHITPRWKNDGTLGRDPDAEKPFMLQDFSADEVPEVVVADYVDKAGQNYDLLRFDKKSKRLVYEGGSMGVPIFMGGYIILRDCSRNKSEWESWTYYKWEGNKLLQKADWEECTPWHAGSTEVDDSFESASRTGKDGIQETFKISDGTPDGNAVEYYISKNEKAFATIIIDWSKTPRAKDGSDHDYPYLFHKLTGLPRALYSAENLHESSKELKVNPRVKVTGGPEAQALFGNEP